MNTHRIALVTPGVLLLGLLGVLPHTAGQERPALGGTFGTPDGKKEKDGKKDKGPLKHLEVKVGGKTRDALVAYPKTGKDKKPAPVVFVFHGHGNTMKGAAEAFECHEHWDEAICVYPQGVKTPSPNDPQGKESGWELEGKRDYLFFDALLAKLKRENAVDDDRIFATGFSNGAFFTFGLWEERGATLRAVASCGGFFEGTGLTPKPCLLIAGAKDKMFEKQKDTIALVRKVNGCKGEGEDWPKHKSKLHGTLYPTTKGAPTAKIIHDGGHFVPNAAGPLIVEFFKEVTKK